MISKYRLQLSPNGDWTEWRNFDNPPKEEYCSSIQISEECTKEQIEEFMNKNFKVEK